jgi:hypothetical protein
MGKFSEVALCQPPWYHSCSSQDTQNTEHEGFPKVTGMWEATGEHWEVAVPARPSRAFCVSVARSTALVFSVYARKQVQCLLQQREEDRSEL